MTTKLFGYGDWSKGEEPLYRTTPRDCCCAYYNRENAILSARVDKCGGIWRVKPH
jgi:hypothetical protein